MCVYMYIYIYTHIYMCIRAHILTRICTYVHPAQTTCDTCHCHQGSQSSSSKPWAANQPTLPLNIATDQPTKRPADRPTSYKLTNRPTFQPTCRPSLPTDRPINMCLSDSLQLVIYLRTGQQPSANLRSVTRWSSSRTVKWQRDPRHYRRLRPKLRAGGSTCQVHCSCVGKQRKRCTAGAQGSHAWWGDAWWGKGAHSDIGTGCAAACSDAERRLFRYHRCCNCGILSMHNAISMPGG